MAKRYSPCIDICKYQKNGHCRGCSMTKIQKKISKTLKTREKQQAFVDLIRMQQKLLGGYDKWEKSHKIHHND